MGVIRFKGGGFPCPICGGPWPWLLKGRRVTIGPVEDPLLPRTVEWLISSTFNDCIHDVEFTVPSFGDAGQS